MKTKRSLQILIISQGKTRDCFPIPRTPQGELACFMNNVFSTSCLRLHRIKKQRRKTDKDKMNNATNTSQWKGRKGWNILNILNILLMPFLFLSLLLLVNGCAPQKISRMPKGHEGYEQDLDAENRAIREKALRILRRKDKARGATQKRTQKRTLRKQSKKKVKSKAKKKNWKKKPATQRPYVIEGRTYYPIPSAEGYEEIGLASWYGDPFHGRKTANGETYDMYGITAAHKTLPMGTMLLVKNLANGKTATVRINDRGPFVDGRIIDLSHTTAKALGILQKGTGKVKIVALGAAEEQDEQSEHSEQRTQEEDIVGALAEENHKERMEDGIPILVAQYKKKKKKSTTQNAVLRPQSKKKRISQDFDTGNFYIQVRSFDEKTKARTLAQTFAAKGRDVIIQEFAAAGVHLFRVLVFSSTSLKKAKQDKEALKRQGYEHAFVIARDKKKKGAGK
ncbi:MAG: septal ring lytic transglycosylase RlpA family protein [Candidatus Electrothrix sp. AUS3]|nr:septal ring lytic transglycosylase RlpA family protein [Candidatus Electrothrix gigas]